MSVGVTLLVYDVDKKYLTSTEGSVLARLALHGNDRGQSIYPSYNKIVNDTKFTRRAVIKTINTLVEKGFLHREQRARGSSNFYSINIQMLKRCQRLKNKASGKLSADDLSTPSSDLGSLGGDPHSLGVVSYDHHPGDPGAPKSNIKEEESKNKHTQKGNVSGLTNSVVQQVPINSTSEVNPANDASFNSLKDLWFKKEDFTEARKFYDAIVPNKISAEKVFEAEKKKMQSLEANNLNADSRIRFCPKLTIWLQNERYFDDPHVPTISPQSSLSPQDARKQAQKEEALRRVSQLVESEKQLKNHI